MRDRQVVNRRGSVTNKNNKYGAGPAVSGFELSGLVVATALVCTPAWSGETIEFDNGTTIDWTVTTSYGLGVRLSNPSSKLLTPNADDGDRNFDKGSLVTNRIGALAEMIVRKDNYGGCCGPVPSTMMFTIVPTTTTHRARSTRLATMTSSPATPSITAAGAASSSMLMCSAAGALTMVRCSTSRPGGISSRG